MNQLKTLLLLDKDFDFKMMIHLAVSRAKRTTEIRLLQSPFTDYGFCFLLQSSTEIF